MNKKMNNFKSINSNDVIVGIIINEYVNRWLIDSDSDYFITLYKSEWNIEEV